MDRDILDRCQYKKCGKEIEVIYLGRGLCEKHWEKVCKMPREKVYELFGIKIAKEICCEHWHK